MVNKSFCCRDFFRLGLYEEGIVKEEQIYEAIKNYNLTNFPDYNIGVIAIKKKENFQFKFNPHALKQELLKLRNDTFDKINICYGVGIFDAMREVFENDYPFWCPDSYRRFFHFIHDSLQLMRARIICMKKSQTSNSMDILDKRCQELQKQCIYYRNLFLKIEIKIAKGRLKIEKKYFPEKDLKNFSLLKQEYILLVDGLVSICDEYIGKSCKIKSGNI